MKQMCILVYLIILTHFLFSCSSSSVSSCDYKYNLDKSECLENVKDLQNQLTKKY